MGDSDGADFRGGGGSAGAEGGGAGPDAAVRKEGRDDPDAGRRAAAHGNLCVQGSEGGAADFHRALALRNFRREKRPQPDSSALPAYVGGRLRLRVPGYSRAVWLRGNLRDEPDRKSVV